MHDVIIVGGGLNGLITGALLSRRKLSVLVLERQPTAGGAAVTMEIAPGFRVPRLSHAVGPINRRVIRALHLDRADGLEFLTPDPSLTTLGPHGETIAFHPDPVLTAGSIHAISPADAARWREFLQLTHRVARLAASVAGARPPSLDRPTMAERWGLLRLARRARQLGSRDLARTARWTTMPIRDLLDEWLDNDLLKAAIAARAIFGNPAGPRSPGTSAAWIQHLAGDDSPVGSGATVRGGPGALADALVSMINQSGGAVRTEAQVAGIPVRGGRAAGVVLSNGDEVPSRAVVSAVDPRQTFLDLVEPDDLAPSFREKIRRYRARGVTAKINLALSALPEFVALRGDPVTLRGRLLIAPTLDYLERAFDAAKYGRISPEPWLEIAVPSMLDHTLAPEDRHVMSVYVHFAPRHLRDAAWSDSRDEVFRRAMDVIAPHAPRLEASIVAREILTPEDLERDWGLSGGHIFHGELSLDQSWLARPALGWARYETPIAGLYLAGAGTHPGGGLTGTSAWLAAETVLRTMTKSERVKR